MNTVSAFQFELVAPEEKLVSEPMAHVVIPGVEGELGIGPGHAAFVVALKPGVVRLYRNGLGDKPRRIFIAGGFADITGAQCTVLAEQAMNVDELDKAALEQKLADLTEDLGIAKEAIEKARIQKRIALVKAKLEAVRG